MLQIANSISPRVDPVTIWRYKKSIIVPAVAKTFAKINELKQMRDACEPLADSIVPDTYGQVRSANVARSAETSREALVSPFLERLSRKYDRYDKLLSEAVKGCTALTKTGDVVTLSPDLKAIAALDACETRSMDLHAKLVGAIAPESTGVVTNNIVLMLPRPVDGAPARPLLDDGNCIDIEAVD